MGSTTKVSGSITTQNLVPAGAATAASAVATPTNGDSGMSIQVTGTYTGALSVQGTIDGTTWVTLGGTPLLNIADGVKSATIASAATGIFYVNVSGLLKVRVTALAAVTGTAVVSLIVTDQAGVFFLASETEGGGGAEWGGITGTLSDQTDLQTALDNAGGGGGGDVSYADSPATFTGGTLGVTKNYAGSTNVAINNSNVAGSAEINANAEDAYFSFLAGGSTHAQANKVKAELWGSNAVTVAMDTDDSGLYVNINAVTHQGVVGTYSGDSDIHLAAFAGNHATKANRAEINAEASAGLFISSSGGVAIASGVSEYADDAAAAAGSVPVGGLYRTASVLKIRVA